METSWRLSIGDVLDQLLADDLIDSCHMTNDHVTIMKGTKRHTFTIVRALPVLVGMLRGRTWYEGPVVTSSDPPVSPLRAVEKNRTTPVQPWSPALDELLALARQMKVIEGYERDATRDSLKISLRACETEMLPDEALAFLAECILHTLTEMRLETLGGVADSGPETAVLISE